MLSKKRKRTLVLMAVLALTAVIVAVLIQINPGRITGTVGGDIGRESSAVALGDLDGDGDLDVVLADPGTGPDEVWLNDGSGHFPVAQEFSEKQYYSSDVALVAFLRAEMKRNAARGG